MIVGRDVPAIAGMPLAEVATPALILDLQAFEANLAVMADWAATRGVALRPHGKAHKCPDIALRQVAAGAAGICCQKVSEAELFVDAGLLNVLVANEVVAPAKLDRLAALARRAAIGVCVDDSAAVPLLSAAATRLGVTLACHVEVEVGARRCGVAPGAPAAALARAIADAPGLAFAGLQAYHGSAQHLRTPAERAAAIAAAAALVEETKAALAAAGLSCPAVTGAGTGTFPLEVASGVWTEIQPGTYAFGDADYARNTPDPAAPRFAHSLFVLTEVMSVAVPGQAVCDAGHKAHAIDSGLPTVHARPDLAYVSASDEHGVIRDLAGTLRLRDRLQLVPGHCDPTFNLHDHVITVRNGIVEAVWPIAARGRHW